MSLIHIPNGGETPIYSPSHQQSHAVVRYCVRHKRSISCNIMMKDYCTKILSFSRQRRQRTTTRSLARLLAVVVIEVVMFILSTTSEAWCPKSSGGGGVSHHHHHYHQHHVASFCGATTTILSNAATAAAAAAASRRQQQPPHAPPRRKRFEIIELKNSYYNDDDRTATTRQQQQQKLSNETFVEEAPSHRYRHLLGNVMISVVTKKSTEATTTMTKMQSTRTLTKLEASPAANSTVTMTGNSSSMESLERAVAHTMVIFELYNDTNKEQAELNSIDASSSSSSSSTSKVSSSSSSNLISADLVLTTLESVLRRCLREQQNSTCSHLTTDSLLLQEKVEALVWRIVDLQLIPSRLCLEYLWQIQQSYPAVAHAAAAAQQQHVDTASSSSSSSSSSFTFPEIKASQHVGRSVKLLRHWMTWSSTAVPKSSSSSSRSSQNRIMLPPPPPPHAYVIQILDYALQHNVTMSFALWDLYNTIHYYHSQSSSSSSQQQSLQSWSYSGGEGHRQPLMPPRVMYTQILKLLSRSNKDWNVRQRRVCQDLIFCARRHRKKALTADAAFSAVDATNTKNSHDDDDESYKYDTYMPTLHELKQSLQAAARAGRAQDATWLMRFISTTISSSSRSSIPINATSARDQQKNKKEKDVSSSDSSSLLAIHQQNKDDLDVDEQYSAACQLLFWQALLHSKEPGSLAYMEQLLFTMMDNNNDNDDHDNQNKMNRDKLNLPYRAFKMLLQKWATSRQPGAGKRAVLVYTRMQDFYHHHNRHDNSNKVVSAATDDNNNNNLQQEQQQQQNTPWQQQPRPHPIDWEAVYYVASAYLNENFTSLAHIQAADRFVRKVVMVESAASVSYNPRLESIMNNNNNNIDMIDATTSSWSPNNATELVATAVSRSSSSSSWRVFDRLLGSYTSHMKTTLSTATPARRTPQSSIDNNNNSKINKQALKSANQLFEFFMIAHRNGCLVGSGEEPDCYHLGHVLRHWNLACWRQSFSSSSSSSSSSSTGARATAKMAAAKSLEYYRLFSNGIASCQPPDVFNIRQVLGTLAKSGQTGYGYIAELLLNETLQRVLQERGNDDSTSSKSLSVTAVDEASSSTSTTRTTPASTRLDPYALGHMFWCVIACHCQDEWIMEHHCNDDSGSVATSSTKCSDKTTSGIPAAVNVLKRLEDLHARQPYSVFLTGASYQTIVSCLANRITAARKTREKDCSNEMGQQELSSSLLLLLSQYCARIAVEIVQRAETQFYDNGNTRVRLLGQLYRDALECCEPLLLAETNDDDDDDE